MLEKFRTPFGTGILLLAGLLFSLIVANAGLSAGVILLGAIAPPFCVSLVNIPNVSLNPLLNSVIL